MTSSAILLGLVGVLLTFLPLEIMNLLEMEATKPFQLPWQILGALYFAFGMLNWTAKGSRIGGIYNRPIVVANFAHFMIGGLALLKAVFSNPELPNSLWILTIVYAYFAVVFGIMLFRHPVKENH